MRFSDWLIRKVEPGQRYVLKGDQTNPFRQDSIIIVAKKRGWVQYAYHWDTEKRYLHETNAFTFRTCYIRIEE